jgi:hypothetical protein
MGDEQPDFVLVFTTDAFDQKQVLAGIRSLTGEAPLLGCCGGGVISREGLSRDSIAVMTLKSDDLRVIPGLGRAISQDARRAAELVAQEVLIRQPEDAAEYQATLLMLPDGLTSASLADLVRGAADTAGPLCQLVGGGAGDNVKFVKTCQFINGEIHSDAVAVALILSRVPVGVGVQHGWSAVGRPLVVTRAEGTMVKELDGRAAFEAYLDQFGAEYPELSAKTFAEFAMEHPLGLPQMRGEYVIRDPLKAFPDGSLACVAAVPENAVVRIMRGNKESLLTAARQAAEQSVKSLGGPRPALAIIFDCVSRLLLLGEDAQREIDLVRSVIGRDTPLIGLFSFGEIAAQEGNPPAFHNKTVVVCTIAQRGEHRVKPQRPNPKGKIVE